MALFPSDAEKEAWTHCRACGQRLIYTTDPNAKPHECKPRRLGRFFIRAGQLSKIEALDHVIISNPDQAILRELGCFYA